MMMLSEVKDMQFEKNLTLLRKKKGLTQDELAFAIGVTRQTIYTWEAGTNYPTIVALKKIADVLEVSTDDLLNGFTVNRLPNTFMEPVLTYVSKHEEKVIYDELPNWFISLKPGSEVSWGIYDLKNGKYVKDYSYHVDTLDEVKIHNEEGVEIEVKEYDPSLTLERDYHQYVSLNEEGTLILGESVYEGEKKCIRTFKDKDFLKDWGYNKKLERQPIVYLNAENYVLVFNEKKHNVIKLSYFENDKEIYCEVYLNNKNESLYWRRFTKTSLKKRGSGIQLDVEGVSYDLDYVCITTRIL